MIRFELVTLSGTKFSQDVYEVLLPTPDGQIAVFRHHMPLVSLAAPGVVSIRPQENTPDDLMQHYAISGGVVEVRDNAVRVLVDEADDPEELNEQEIQEALELARKMRNEAKDQIELEKAQSLIDRQAVRLKVAGLRRHRRSQYK